MILSEKTLIKNIIAWEIYGIQSDWDWESCDIEQRIAIDKAVRRLTRHFIFSKKIL